MQPFTANSDPEQTPFAGAVLPFCLFLLAPVAVAAQGEESRESPAVAAEAPDAAAPLATESVDGAADPPTAVVVEAAGSESEDAPPASAPPPVVAADPDAMDERASESPPSAAEETALLSLLDDSGTDEPSIDVYGFGDFGYFAYLLGEDNAWNNVIWQGDQFMVGNLNVYLRGNLGAGWSSLLEVRYLFLPNGSGDTNQSGEQVLTDTSVEDQSELGRTIKWAGIEIERAWVEYAPRRFFAIRGGEWLTPYGVWNIEHGSPTTINVGRPYLTGEQLFPERQTGLQASGSIPIGEHEVGYHLTISNGRGPASEYQDFDDDLAFGGRLWANLRLAGEMKVGISAYDGRYTEKVRRFGLALDDRGRQTIVGTDRVLVAYDERAFGADLVYTRGGLTLVAEAAVNDRAYTRKGRPVLSGFAEQGSGLAPDQREWGAYGLAGYRFAWLGVMPYVMVERFAFGESNPFASIAGLRNALGYLVGVNVRPLPRVVIKAEVQMAVFPDAVPGSPGDQDSVNIARVQTAWAF